MFANSTLQEGIYYSHSDSPRNSLSIIFLRAREPAEPRKIRETLASLWRMYKGIQKGIIGELDSRIKNPYRSTLSVLLGYGPRVFDLEGLKKSRPEDLSDQWLFRQPKSGGDPIIPNSGLTYALDITSNEVANDHFLFQFIGETQLATHRVVVDTWKHLRKIDMDGSSASLVLRSFFTGFNRPDGRGWLGFHDGVSNIKSHERLKEIQIERRRLNPPDQWTANGTYMTFLRIVNDLTIWESIPVKIQERIVGRAKTTGCPLSRVDERGNNIFIAGCPVAGTREITQRGNERYRDYVPSYYSERTYGPSVSEARESHIERMRKVPGRIFRQGYEFLEPIEYYPYFRAGLNFISFQGSTAKIYNSIRYGFDRVNFGGSSTDPFPGTDHLLTVRAAGLFLVPPIAKEEDFPGATIFPES